ncbi:MAG: hypothetical protein ACXVPU_17520 [Bacteroidia bacterium]
MIVEQQLLPEAQKLVDGTILEIVKEQGPKTAFIKMYNKLPFYIQAVIKEEAFTAFCMSNQDKIFGTSLPTGNSY